MWPQELTDALHVLARIYWMRRWLYVHTFFVRDDTKKALLEFKHAELAKFASHVEKLLAGADADASFVVVRNGSLATPLTPEALAWLKSFRKAAGTFCQALCDEVEASLA